MAEYGQSLPGWLRERFERAAGEGLGELRVREHAWVGDAGALALCRGHELWLAPGAYRPDSDAGARLLAHEVAHVLQQRAGRVPARSAAAGGDILDDPALEAEAERLAESLVRGRPLDRAWPAAPRRRDQRALPFQPYRVIAAGQLAAAGITVGNATFPGQEATAGGSFLLANGHVNIVERPANQVALRLSDGVDMAVEDTNIDLRQARVCFATDACITTNNGVLADRGSKYRLTKMMAGTTPRALSLGGGRVLFQVQMATPTNQPPLSATNNCNEVAGDVLGVNVRGLPARTWPRTPGELRRFWAKVQRLIGTSVPQWTLDQSPAARLACYATERGRGSTPAVALAAALAVRNETDVCSGLTTQTAMMDALATHFEAIARPYSQALAGSPAALLDACRSVGINEWADPLVGDAYHTVSVAGLRKNGADQLYGLSYLTDPPTTIAPCWDIHWGAVVAKKGTDRIVFENYARISEDGGTRNGLEQRGFFEMYEVPSGTTTTPATLAKSWHATWKNTGFANPVTLAITRD